MNAKFFKVMCVLLVIRCVTRDLCKKIFGEKFLLHSILHWEINFIPWHEVAQVRKLQEFFDGSPKSNHVFRKNMYCICIACILPYFKMLTSLVFD